MPTRILRDFTDSPAFDGISAEAERLFVRLLMKADDYGRFHATPKLIRALCFPQSEDLRANTVAAWLTELSARQLVFCYKSGAGEYLALPKFGQRVRPDSKPKFPAPDGEPLKWLPPQSAASRGDPPKVPASVVFEDGDVFEGVVGDAIGAQARKREREDEAEWIERIRQAYPRQGAQQDCRHAIWTAMQAADQTPQQILDDVLACAIWVKQAEEKATCAWIPSAEKFFGGRQWTDPKKFEGIAIRVREAQNKGGLNGKPRVGGTAQLHPSERPF